MLNRYELAKNIYTVELALSRGVKAREKAAENRELVNADVDHTTEWKNKFIAAIDAALSEAFLKNIKPIEALAAYFVDVPNQAREDFSYDDPALQTALNMIDLLKKNLPTSSRVDMVRRFIGNPGALEVLKAAFDKAGYSEGRTLSLAAEYSPEYELLKKEMELFDSFVNVETVFDEFISYATVSGYQPGFDIEIKPQWKDELLYRLMRRFKTAFNIDTEHHPLIKAIRDFQEQSEDRYIKSRIDRFLTEKGKAIDVGDEYAVKQGEKYLAAGFRDFLSI